MSSVLHWLWYCFDLSGCWKTRRGKFSVKRKYQNSGRHDFCESRELSYRFLLSISSDFRVRNQIVKYDCFTDLTNSPQQNNSFQPWCWFCAPFLVHSKFFSQISMISCFLSKNMKTVEDENILLRERIESQYSTKVC